MSPDAHPNISRRVQGRIKEYTRIFKETLETIALSLAKGARKDTVDSSDVDEAYQVICTYLVTRIPWWRVQKSKFVALSIACFGAQVLGVWQETFKDYLSPVGLGLVQWALFIFSVTIVFWGWLSHP